MKGFFTKEQTKSKFRSDGKSYSCASCSLYLHVLSPRMKPFGNFKKGILNLGEASGETEDKKGKQWQGKVGRKLQRTYRQLGFDLFEDCLNINSINCRPTDKKGNNREPSLYEIACCRSRVLQLIEEKKPQVIIAFGNSAIASLLDHRWKKDLGGITKWRGWTIPDRDLNAWLCPVWHPSFVERSEGIETETIWKQDLKRALSMTDIPFPKYQEEKNQIEIIEDINVIKKIRSNIAIDIETNSLKPHSSDSRIISFAICPISNYAYTFLMPHEKQQILELKKFFRKGPFCIAHNMKFEHAWIKNKLNLSIRNWVWDSMLAAHILDNRPGITGLKFQVYVHFGVIDYDSEISSYLQSIEKGGNSLNKIGTLLKSRELTKKLLQYNALDTIYTYKLAKKQMEQIGVDHGLE